MKLRVLGAQRAAGMNKTEGDYALILEARRAAGQIAAWRYEGLRLKLGDGSYYTADFALLLPDGTLELHETKGFMREAARVRLRSAAAQWPVRIVLIRRDPRVTHGWLLEDVPHG